METGTAVAVIAGLGGLMLIMFMMQQAQQQNALLIASLQKGQSSGGAGLSQIIGAVSTVASFL